MANNHNRNRSESGASRRRVLAGLGSAGLTMGLAGCSGGSDDTTAETTSRESDEGTAAQGGEPMDSSLTLTQQRNPNDSKYNPHNSAGMTECRRALFDRFMFKNLAAGEYEGYAISEWSYEGQSLSLTVRDGLTWHDGNAVSATDLVTYLKLHLYTNGSLSPYVDDVAGDVTADGERTVTVALNTRVNEEILLAYLQPMRMSTPTSVFGEFVTKFENASSDEEMSSVTSELQNFGLDEPVGCGPFEFEDADAQRILLTKFKDHPDADNVNFPEVEYRFASNNQNRWAALINGETDGEGTLFMPSNKVNQLPESVNVGLVPRHTGMGLVFNNEDEVAGDLNVRKAVAHIVNRDQIAAASGGGTDTKVGVDVPAFLTSQFNNDIENRWLDGVYDKFDPYGPDKQKATQYLQDAGYSKSGGTWQDGDGNPLSLEVKCTAAFSDWVSACEAIVSQLQEFGIDASLLTVEGSSYWGTIYEHDYQLCVEFWASYSQSHPYFHMQKIWGEGGIADLAQVDPVVEADTLNGETQKVDMGKRVSELSSQTGDEATGSIQELAYLSNQTLPIIPMMEKLSQTFVTTDDWNVPSTDSDKLQVYWPTEWGYRQGWWTAKQS